MRIPAGTFLMGDLGSRAMFARRMTTLVSPRALGCIGFPVYGEGLGIAVANVSLYFDLRHNHRCYGRGAGRTVRTIMHQPRLEVGPGNRIVFRSRGCDGRCARRGTRGARHIVRIGFFERSSDYSASARRRIPRLPGNEDLQQ